ncbi:hypothetical protein OROMI_031909 [Orobanche minor]
MGGFGVIRYAGDDCVGPKYHLSVLSPKDLSVSENLDLPFDNNETVYGGSCGGLLYFHGLKGQIFIVNLTTNESITVPPPNFEPLPSVGSMRTSGLGYDVKSGDYKVIRMYDQYYYNEADIDGVERYLGDKNFFELYSFKCGSWKELRRPDTWVHNGTGVYVEETGRCYWSASYNTTGEEYCKRVASYEELLQSRASFDGSLDSLLHHVLSFDLATESFRQFPLPATAIGPNAIYKLVKYRGSLGALVYDNCYSPSSSEFPIELFVRKGRWWEHVYSVSLADVRKALGVGDNCLFLEAKPRCDRSRLMVYYLATKTLKELDIYDDPGILSDISYAESTGPPQPDSIPKANYDFSRKERSMKGKKGKKRRSKKGKGKGKKRKPHSRKHRR